MRIACLQFNPQVGDVDNNLTRADRVLSKASPESLDLLVLPEMAFSGYNFKSLRDIHDYLEPTAAGISSLWARTMALKHNCHVVVGYPETADVSHKWPTAPEYFNAAIAVGPDGDKVAHYRKTHLYYTDEPWALEGSKFYGDHITGLGQVAMGICMDINPYKFQTPWDTFEFGYHVVKVDANLVIVSMAWLTNEDGGTFTSQPQEPDMNTLTYWVTRLEPVIRAESDDEVIVVFCNRCGSEDEALYAGTSAVVGIKGGEVNVYGLLGRGEKKLLVVDTNKPPFAKLMLTPAGSTMVVGSTRKAADQGAQPEVKSATNNGRRDYEAVLDQTRQPEKMAPLVPVAYDYPRRAKMSPPKLTIPHNTTSSWKRARELGQEIPTPEGPSPTPGHRRPNIDAVFAAAQSRPSSRTLPDSAIAMGPGDSIRQSQELHNRPGSLRDSRDSGLGRATPDNRSSVGSQRKPAQPLHRSSLRNSETIRSTSSRREDSPSLRVDTKRGERRRQERENAKDDEAAPNRFLDSPVFRKPDSSMLSYWLDSLPANSTPKPVESQGSSGSPRPQDVSPVKSDKLSTISPTHTCHHCGHSLASDGKMSTASGVPASDPLKLEEPRKPRQRGQKEDIQQWRYLVEEELQRRRDQSEQRTLTSEGLGSEAEVLPDAPKQPTPMVVEPQPKPSIEDAGGKKASENSAETAPNPLKPSFVPLDRATFDPMAPRTSIVPPPIKGMDKPVFPDERPRSLAW